MTRVNNPALSEEREIRVVVYVNKEERDTIEEAAIHDGRGMSDFGRKVMLDKSRELLRDKAALAKAA